MAEPTPSFAALGPDVPIARASVRITTPPDLLRTTAADPITYAPLDNPDAPSEHGYSPPNPTPAAPPTECLLRENLTQCVAVRDFANEGLRLATETSQRATAHREACEIRLRDFVDLDDRITQQTIDGLRSGHGRTMDSDDPLRRLVIERGQCRDDLVAATKAEAILGNALTDAKTEADAATKAAHVAAVTLSHLLAEREAQRVLAMEVEIARLREIVLAADVPGVTAPQAMRTIQADGSRYRRPIDRSQWAALRQRLLADPSAELTLESDREG